MSKPPDMVRPRVAVRDASIAEASDVATLMTTLGYPTTSEEMRTRLAHISASGDYVSLVAPGSQAL